MTANTLSNKDRAKVASECRNKKFEVIEWNGTGVEFDAFVMFNWRSADQEHWSPAFDGHYVTAWQRSQALTLVEWLADNIDDCYSSEKSRLKAYWDVISFVHKRDTAALEYMAHQMITKGKEDE